ncbi:T-box protein VegT-A [Trichinella pseudospiralis]
MLHPPYQQCSAYNSVERKNNCTAPTIYWTKIPGKFDRLTFTTATVDEQQNLVVPTSQRRQTILIHYNF